MKAKSLIFSFFILFFVFACQSNPYAHGKRLYEAYCGSCHMEDGQGLKSLVPPLAKSDYLTQNQDKLVCIINKGLNGSIVVNGKEYNQPMAGIPKLDPTQLTNIINYINHAWGNDAGYTKIQDVEAALENCNRSENDN